jgi:hypothetical protein
LRAYPETTDRPFWWIAAEIGVANSALRNLKNGKTKPQSEYLDRIEAFLRRQTYARRNSSEILNAFRRFYRETGLSDYAIARMIGVGLRRYLPGSREYTGRSLPIYAKSIGSWKSMAGSICEATFLSSGELFDGTTDYSRNSRNIFCLVERVRCRIFGPALEYEFEKGAIGLYRDRSPLVSSSSNFSSSIARSTISLMAKLNEAIPIHPIFSEPKARSDQYQSRNSIRKSSATHRTPCKKYFTLWSKLIRSFSSFTLRMPPDRRFSMALLS